MILVGLAYFILAAVVIGWGEILAGAAMILTGAVAVTFGAAMIGPCALAARAAPDRLGDQITPHLNTGINARRATTD